VRAPSLLAGSPTGAAASGVASRLRWRRDAVVTPGESITVSVGANRLRLPPVSTGITEAVAALQRGADETELQDIVTAQGAGLAEWAAVLTKLRRVNLLDVSVHSDGRILATLQPRAVVAPARLPSSPDAPVILDRFAHLRSRDGSAVLEGAGARGAVVVHDPRVGALLVELASGSTIAALSRGPAGLDRLETTAIVRLIGQAGLLAAMDDPAGATPDAGQPDPTGGVTVDRWSFADRLFHAQSRKSPEVTEYGATGSRPGRRPSLPAVKAVTGETVALARPDAGAVARTDLTLDDAMRRRRSVRDYDEDRPITAAQLGEVLFRSQRVLRVGADHGHGEVMWRPYPTGGGLQELEIYPVVDRCDGLPAGLYRYDGLGHRLEIVGPVGPASERLLDGASSASGRSSPPQVLLVVTARWGRVMGKYESMAYALVLKDLGVLYQTLYLVATSMGLAPCALGGGEAGILEPAAGLDPAEEAVVGEFMLGGRPADRLPALPQKRPFVVPFFEKPHSRSFLFNAE
jgi:SagB-type dehydrogenase family enzyme